jgi:hypothetical protein
MKRAALIAVALLALASPAHAEGPKPKHILARTYVLSITQHPSSCVIRFANGTTMAGYGRQCRWRIGRAVNVHITSYCWYEEVKAPGLKYWHFAPVCRNFVDSAW